MEGARFCPTMNTGETSVTSRRSFREDFTRWTHHRVSPLVTLTIAATASSCSREFLPKGRRGVVSLSSPLDPFDYR